MKIDDSAWIDENFRAYHARFAPYFHRPEPREQGEKYLRALLAPVERKNGWQIAEFLGDSTPDRIQRLLSHAGWDVDGVGDEHIRFCELLQGEAVLLQFLLPFLRVKPRKSTRKSFQRTTDYRYVVGRRSFW